MLAKIIGQTPVIKGESKKTGKPYHGQTLHLEYQDRKVEGKAVLAQFVSFESMQEIPTFKIGNDVMLDYDDKGFLLSVQVISSRKD